MDGGNVSHQTQVEGLSVHQEVIWYGHGQGMCVRTQGGGGLVDMPFHGLQG